MLTFCFSGADGKMTAPEMLTSGMVGQKVKFSFSPEWSDLTKTAVFTAGNITRDAVVNGDEAVIPADVLERPLQLLLVGVYGVSSEGTLVIPTIRAKGPMIAPGVDPSGDPGTDPDLAVWAQILALIGQLSDLETAENSDLVSAINGLSRRLDRTGGLSDDAVAMLTGILRNGVYTADQSDEITALKHILSNRAVVSCYVTAMLDNVLISNTAALVVDGNSYTARLTAADGYELDSVTVTMDGVDITGDVYSNGMIRIPAVTGDVVITAGAVIRILLPVAEEIAMGAASYVSGKMQLNATNANRATMVPAGQYLTKGAAYRFSIGNAASAYYYGVQIFTASGEGMTYPYVAGADQYYDTVTARPVDTGWMAGDYVYTPEAENMIVTVNFKNSGGTALSDTDYAYLLENFTIEVVE